MDTLSFLFTEIWAVGWNTPDIIQKQIDAVFEDIEVDAVKIGMLCTPACMNAVAEKLLEHHLVVG